MNHPAAKKEQSPRRTVTTRENWRPFRKRNRVRSALGVDIGSFETKLVWLQARSDKSFQVSHAKFLSFPEKLGQVAENANTDSDDQGADEVDGDRRSGGSNPFKRQTNFHKRNPSVWTQSELQSLLQRVSNAVIGSDLRSSDVLANLSMTVCDVRGICAPRSDSGITFQDQIRESLGDGQSRTFAKLPREEDDSTVRVFSVPERLAISIAEGLETHGLRIKQIDGLPWSQSRCLDFMLDSRRRTGLHLVLDWGFARPTLTLISEGRICYVRRLASGGVEQLISQPQSDLALSQQQASWWLNECARNHTANDDAIRDMWHWVQLCIHQLAREIDAAREYVRWRFKCQDVDGLHLVGGGAAIAPLVDALQQELQLPSQSWTTKIGGTELSAEFAIAMSLAWEGVSHGS